MKTVSSVIRFDKEYLHDVIEDKDSCVKLENHNYHIALHPYHLNNINESIKDILNKMIAKYDPSLDGILLGYQNIKLLSSSGAINNDTCFLHIDIAAEFFIFKPEIGKLLTGTVNKKSAGHVSCLLYKTFNVTLPKPEDDEDWMGFVVNIGQDILFRITFIDLEGRLPYIRATFVSILSDQDSGISTSEDSKQKPKRITFEDDSEEEVETPKIKKKRKKHAKEKSVDEETNMNDVITDSSSTSKKHKKKKPQYVEENNISIKEEKYVLDKDSSDLNDSSKTKEKKNKTKHKHSREVVEIDNSNNIEGSESYLAKDFYNSQQYENIDTEVGSNHLEKKKSKVKHTIKTEPESDDNSLDQFRDTILNDVFQNVENSEKTGKKKKEHLIEETSKSSKKHTKNDASEKASKSKKSKLKNSLQALQDSVLNEVLSGIDDIKSKKIKKEELSDNSKDDILDISIPDLNISSLFTENTNDKWQLSSNFTMADNEDRGFKKRPSLTSVTIPFEDPKTFEICPELNVDNLLNNSDIKVKTKITKKRKISDDSSDEFEVPVKRRKNKW